MRDMMSTLSVRFEVTGFEDMLVCIPAPAPLAPTPARAPARAPSLSDDDDVDLRDF